MPRDLCLTCGNAGVVIEWRLVWKEFREGRGLVQCAVRRPQWMWSCKAELALVRDYAARGRRNQRNR